MQTGAAASSLIVQAQLPQALKAQQPPIKNEANDPPAERAAELVKARGGVDIKV